MKSKYLLHIIVLSALLALLVPGSVNALVSPPPADMFQWPWEQGQSWVAFDGFDNGFLRLTSSPHNHKVGGAIDFAPHNNMVIGEDTSNFWVVAAAAGTIIEASSCHVKIDHGNGWITEYWHLANIQKTSGAVSRNQRLGVIADNKFRHVCVGNEYPGPHLHFVMRPKMIETTFSGWTINYNVFTNITTFTKNGQTVGRNKPILNAPSLQIALRDPITWDTLYIGTVDAYRYERWPFQLSESSTFTLTVTPTTSGLTPIVVLLDSNGNEITRANGTLTSTQPAGSYFVQVQPQTGSGFYNLVLVKDSSTPPTPTPTSTGTLGPTATSVSTITPGPSPTPVSTFTPGPSPTPVSTFTPGPSPTPEATITPGPSPTPISTDPSGDTATPTPTAASGPTATSVFTNTPLPTATPVLSEPFVSSLINPSTITVGESATVSVNMANIPAEGYTSTEFYCTYDPLLVEVSNIAVAGLFGADPVAAINGPQNGGFIIAIAGSNGNKATATGNAFTFSAKGLQVAQATIQCTARVSKGDSVLTSILSMAANLNILGIPTTPPATPTFVPSVPLVTGQVLASKPVTIRLYNADNSIAASVIANADGTFNLTASPGSYTITAIADGFLSAQGTTTLANGTTSTMPVVNLIAGDLDGNGVIDQFDALTIGMSYNTAVPAVADLNNDGIINVIDLELLAANYRASGALVW